MEEVYSLNKHSNMTNLLKQHSLGYNSPSTTTPRDRQWYQIAYSTWCCTETALNRTYKIATLLKTS